MKSLKYLFTALILTGYALQGFPQVPDVLRVDKISGTFGEHVTIAGSGFSETKTDLVVHFGASKGVIINSSEYLIEVFTPPGATYDNISVTNLKTGSTGFARSFYNLSFNGQDFEPSDIKESTRIQEEVALFDLCNCDFNGDGLNDVATTNNSEDASTSSITVYQNTTAADALEMSFSKVADLNLNISKAARNVTCGDLDSDGKPDLVVGKGGGNADRIYIFRNSSDANISFEPAITLLLSEDVSSSTTRRLKIHDLDKNGKPDIIMTDQGEGKVFIFENKSIGNTISFPPEKRKSIPTSAGSLVGLDAADLNNDGKPEIICNSDKSDVFIIANNSVAGRIDMGTPIKKTITGTTLVNTRIGDLDNDGDKDVVITNFVNNIYVLINEGDENDYSFSTPKYIETGRAPWGLDLGDINGDGLVDILVTTTDETDPLTVLINTSNATGLSYIPYNIGNTDKSFNITVSDFNGDAKPDIGYVNRKSNELIFLRNTQCIIADILPKNPPAICSNKPVRLKSVPAPKADYTWQNTVTAEILTGNFDIDIAQPGSYAVTIKSEAGACESTSETVSVVDGGDNLPPVVNISNPGAVCEGTDFKLSADLVAGVNYIWSTPAGEILTGNELTVSEATIENGGRYTLILESAGCRTDPILELVEISSLPKMEIASSEGNSICEGISTILSVAFVPDATYTWYFDGNVIAGSTANSYTVTESGKYKLSIQNSNFCTAESNELTIKQLVQPTASFAEISGSCLDEEILFQNTSIYDAFVTPIFQWDFGDGTFSSEKNPTHTYTELGNYKVSLRVGYDNSECVDITEQTIDVGEFIDLHILVDGTQIVGSNYNLCNGNEVELSVNAGQGEVKWNTGETSPSIVINSPGDYSVTYSNETGCSGSDALEVNLVNNVSLEITTGIQRIASGTTAQLGAAGADFYLWSPADNLDDAAIPNPLASPLVTTEYSVKGWNSFGCEDIETVMVYVDERIMEPIDAPRAFTPNGDLQNDEWKIRNIDKFESCPIRIFNRRGQNVYEASEYRNDWNGIYNGQELPEGAYYYIITCSPNQVYSGDITLLR